MKPPTAGVSIGDLFPTSFLPGLMPAGFYVAHGLIVSRLRPGMAPPPQMESIPRDEKLLLLKGLVLPLMAATFVPGSIYAGIASATEASAVGGAGAALSAPCAASSAGPSSKGRRCGRSRPSA